MDVFLKMWIFEQHRYEQVLNEFKLELLMDFDAVTVCANCHKKLVFNDGYASYQWHNDIGFGYPVCEKCFKNEMDLRKKYRDEEAQK
jgi:hypothetical protein